VVQVRGDGGLHRLLAEPGVEHAGHISALELALQAELEGPDPAHHPI
jgi:hypothetical protein